jgi:hypothetical protein
MGPAFALLVLLVSGSAQAASPPGPPPDLKPVPDGAPGADEGPGVTIRPSARGSVEEYRVNGRIYMLKITPRVGKPYYFIDTKGDGQFIYRGSLDEGFRPPMWVIKEF